MAKNVLRRPMLRKVVRGYAPEQVDAFVQRAIDRVASLNRENESLKRRLDAAHDEIERLKLEKDRASLSGIPEEDREAARDALTSAAETLLDLAEKFGAPEKEDEPETEAEICEVDDTAPEEPVYEEPAAEEKPETAENVPGFDYSDEVGEGAEEIFYEEEIGGEENPPTAAPEPLDEEDTVEIVEDLTEDLSDEAAEEDGSSDETAQEETEETTEETEDAPEAEETVSGETGAEEAEPEDDESILARLKKAMNLDDPDLPSAAAGEDAAGSFEDFSFTEFLNGSRSAAEREAADARAETEEEAPEQKAAPATPDELDFYSGEEHSDGESFDPSSLIRRNRPGRETDKK